MVTSSNCLCLSAKLIRCQKNDWLILFRGISLLLFEFVKLLETVAVDDLL